MIDVALVGGRSAQSLATQYGLGKDSVQRHRRNCLPARLEAVQAAQQVEVLSAEGLLAEVQRVKLRAEELCDDSLEERVTVKCPHCDKKVPGVIDVKSRAAAIRELRSTIELLAKLTFSVADRPGRASDEDRPDIDALILQVVNEAAPMPQPAAALGAGSDDDVVEATIVG